jgi:DNA polymerase III alpha subunit
MDVDIDLPTNFDPTEYFDVVCASRVQDGKLKKHNVGVYFQLIPKDKITGLAAIPYDKAQELGYFKIDFLHLAFLDNFESKKEIRTLLKIPPDWALLQNPDVVSKLFQLHNNYELLSRAKPQSVQELADCIALIRPAKRKLIPYYVKDKNTVRPEIYAKPEDGRQYFKRAHAISYALTVVLQLHLIKAGIL